MTRKLINEHVKFGNLEPVGRKGGQRIEHTFAIRLDLLGLAQLESARSNKNKLRSAKVMPLSKS